jgi:predicted nucleic acid-binding protein
MTKLVLDASVALKWCVNEPHSDIARQLRQDFQNHEFLAPDIFPIEVGHVLSKMHRQNNLTAQQAELYLADVMTTPPDLYPSLPLMPRAFKLSLQIRKSLWDCLYMALAEQEGCSVVTADLGLIRANPGSRLIRHISSIWQP